MNKENKAIRDALNYDPLAEAEKLTGLSYKESDATAALGFALLQENIRKVNEPMALTNDTNSWNQTAQEWMSVIERLGFKQISMESIPDTEDSFYVWWNDGMLLFADTYLTRINGAEVYLNWRGSNEVRCSLHCSSEWIAKRNGDIFALHYDARQGLRNFIQTLQENGQILKKWIKPPFLWLCHYKERGIDGEHEEINRRRIAQFPRHVQKAMGF